MKHHVVVRLTSCPEAEEVIEEQVKHLGILDRLLHADPDDRVHLANDKGLCVYWRSAQMGLSFPLSDLSSRSCSYWILLPANWLGRPGATSVPSNECSVCTTSLMVSLFLARKWICFSIITNSLKQSVGWAWREGKGRFSMDLRDRTMDQVEWRVLFYSDGPEGSYHGYSSVLETSEYKTTRSTTLDLAWDCSLLCHWKYLW